MTGVANHTLLNLLRDLGCAAAFFHQRTVAGLLVHCADHTQRHAGQAVTTAKCLAFSPSGAP